MHGTCSGVPRWVGPVNRGAVDHVDFSVAGSFCLARGSVELDNHTFGGPQPRLTTAMLLVDRDSPWSTEQLADQLWPSGRPERWRSAVRGLVSHVRRQLVELGFEDDVIVSRSGYYHVELPDLVVDVEAAAEDVARAVTALERGHLAEADRRSSQARAVLSRPILAGIDPPWVEKLRNRVSVDHVESLLVLAKARRAQSRWSPARSVLSELLALAPFREEAWRELMQVELASGNPAAALQVYEDCRQLLTDELGVDPSPASQALHTAILRGAPKPPTTDNEDDRTAPIHALSAGPGGTDGVAQGGDQRSPYVGLRAFEQSDADLFFGRDAAVQRLVDLLAANGIVTVVGPSGSGKSSLVRAGLLPALAAGAIADADIWAVAVFVPGRHPLQSMADAMTGLAADTASDIDGADLADRMREDPLVLHQEATRLLDDIGADDAARILLVIDQAEELFTVADPDETAACLDAVATAIRRRTPRVAAVMTLRADFYTHAASNPDMATLLGRSQLVIPPLSGAEIEAAIVGPARLVDASLERGIVGRIVKDTTGQPGSLPLLQHTLWELWHHRDGSMLTEAGYERIGGLSGALARHAEQTWKTVANPNLVRRILLRAVSPGDEQRADARRPIRRAELGDVDDPDKLDAVLEQLVSSRLLQAETRGGDTVFELAHEALITRWPRLHGWVTEQRAHLVTAHSLSASTYRWLQSDRDPDWLLRGRQLADAGALRAAVESGDLDLALSPQELELVSASQEAEAGDRADRRVERGLAAARLTLSDDPEVSLLLGLGLVEDVADRVPGQGQSLATLLRQGIHRHRLIHRHGNLGALLAVSPDGTLLAVAGHGSTRLDPTAVRLHHVASGELVSSLPGHDDAGLPRAAFSPDGRRLVTGDARGAIRTWDVATAMLQQSWPGPDGPVGGLDVAAESGLVAAWAAIGHDRQLVVFTEDGERIHEVPADMKSAFEEDVPRPGRLVSFHPDGHRLVSATGDVARRVDLFDVATWDVLATTTTSPPNDPTLNVYHEVTSLEWSRDGTQIAAAVGATTRILDGRTLAVVRNVTSDTRTSVTWTSDESRVVTAGPVLGFLSRREPDPVVDTPTPPVVVRPTTRSLDRLRVRGLPHDDHVVVAADRTGVIDVHDVSVAGPAEVANLRPMNARGVAWSPEGNHIALGRGDGVIAIVDTDSWREVDRWQAHPHAGNGSWARFDGPIAWSQDGSVIASVANDGTAAIRHMPSGECITVPVGPASNWPGDCDVTPDGSHVAAVVKGVARILSNDGTIAATLELPSEHLGASRLSADGSLLAIPQRGVRGRAVTATWTTQLWDWRAGDSIRMLGPEEGNYGRCLSFHPDGESIAFSSDDNVIRIVDAVQGHVLHELHGHEDETHEVVHHPHGNLLASSGWDRTVRVWKLDTMEQVGVFDALTGQPGAMAFHPARPWLAVADWSGVVRIWTLDFDELVAIARSRVTRDLTDDERRPLDD